MEISFRILHPEATLPSRAHAGDAGVDLVSVDDAHLEPRGGRALVSTGLSVAIPLGFAGFVLPRSGLAIRHGVTCANAPGLIDSGYRGEIKIALINLDSTEGYDVRKGDRVAQLVVMPVTHFESHESGDLGASERGQGGFGSSGR